ncbi:MAG: 50S ribosomal protein L3 [Candidatus Latescibacteria bacterium]|nr:50S ribosomal protein L3 [Candidatus Latescibacterota bacterium]MCK5327952.1 50S ribosomal protein L3 [Candidatus Latescibacterota bacterium]MCK5525528.1 50S ribosomal protein L3 [Candidatus Latescibacterota bacterium]MCK5733093.1 50S ribosomal protein L3 [Candidatus Latescibacterota bacterium]
MSGILGKKLGMTQIFSNEGERIPVTVIEAGPCPVIQIKTEQIDGYNAVQLGYGAIREKRVNKAQREVFRRAEAKPQRVLKEFRVDDPGAFEVGKPLEVGMFKEGDLVKVTGRSKGKGFAGVIKRHGFRDGPKTHGQSNRLRAPGSIGASSSPSRVWKGQRMAGRMGNERKTVRNLKVFQVDAERNLLIIKGAVPGPRNGIVWITK